MFTSPMGNTFFTADPHFGHKLVAGLRGFDDPDSHDAALIENWRSLVKPEDLVWVLGDLELSHNQEYALGIIDSLPGRKQLIPGNHDPVHPMHSGAHKWQGRYLRSFESVQPFARLKLDGHRVLLSHFPYTADRKELQYTQYRLPDEGRFLLHGHTHSPVKITSDRELHVGLDAWDLRPVPVRHVIDFLNGRLYLSSKSR